MENVWAQVIGGAIAAMIGGLIGFFSAFAIQKLHREDQVRDAKRLRLLDAMAKLHEIYTKLLPYAFFERELSDSDYQKADFVLTLFVIEHDDLWQRYGTKFGKALSGAAKDKFDSDSDRESAFKYFESVLVDLMNDIQERLKSSE